MASVYSIIAIILLALPIMAIDFTWPTVTTSCQVVNLSIVAGLPPYSVYIIPLKGQPFGWTLNEPDDGLYSSTTWPIQVQIPYGGFYSVFMNDRSDFGGGGVTPVQMVNSGPSNCVATASQNASTPMFKFNVTGNVNECQSNFHIDWDGPVQDGPYNMTVIPLDASYLPYEVKLNSSTQTADWTVNMTAGTRFTIMMNNRFGYGHGGIGDVYEVTAGTPGCTTQTKTTNTSSTWPSGLAVASLSPIPTTTSASPSSSASTGGNTPGVHTISLSTGAVVGIAVGAGVVVISIGVLIWWLLRRKRRLGAQSYHAEGKIDMLGASNEDKEPATGITPFQSPDIVASGAYHSLPAWPEPHPTGSPASPGSAPSESGGGTSSYFNIAGNTHLLSPTSNTYTGGGGSDQDHNSRPVSPAGPGIAGIGGGLTHFQPGQTYASAVAEKNRLAREYASLPVHPVPGAGSSASAYQALGPAATSVSGHTGVATESEGSEAALSPDTANTMYRRHTDAGSVDEVQREQEGGVVDLPPMYNEVPRRPTVE